QTTSILTQEVFIFYLKLKLLGSTCIAGGFIFPATQPTKEVPRPFKAAGLPFLSRSVNSY
ncbi:MAG: hypothetical protein LUC92_02000, partial [Clostridiales bacterium]|nr:hypothetical protein [Clostridiales bacterium]